MHKLHHDNLLHLLTDTYKKLHFDYFREMDDYGKNKKSETHNTL